MCLGNQAREANKAAMRQYEYQLKVRERNWMNTISQTNVERVQYDQTLDATHVGLGNAYAEIQEKYGDLIAEATQAQEERFAQFASESTSDQLAASGRTGASVRRIRALDVGKLLSQGSRDAYKLTKARREFNKAGAKAAAQARQAQMQAFAQNNIIKSPDIAPPRPVMQNVGMAAFRDALSIAGSIATIGTIAAAQPGAGEEYLNVVETSEVTETYDTTETYDVTETYDTTETYDLSETYDVVEAVSYTHLTLPTILLV